MTQPWSNSLCGCFDDCSLCCLGWCCPCWLFGENADQIDGSGTFCNCCMFSLLHYCRLAPCIHVSKRRALRTVYGIAEDPNDWVASCCCPCCSLIQEARELRARGAQPGRPIVAQQPR